MYERLDNQIINGDIEGAAGTSVLADVGIADASNALHRLYDHFIKEANGDPIPFTKGDKIGLFFEVLGSSGGIYSYPPAWDYAKTFAPWLAYSFAVTNPISNTLFLGKATDDLVDRISLEHGAPDSIKELVNTPTKKQLVFRYTKMGVGSIICVIPFGVAVYLFPLPGCTETACLATTVAHSIISNTILHAVAWNLILEPQNWYYRLPVLPIEKMYALLKSCLSSAVTKELKQLQAQQEAIHGAYRKVLSNTVRSTTQEMVQRYLIDKNNEDLRMLQDGSMDLVAFVRLAQKHKVLAAPALPPGCTRKMLQQFDAVMRNGAASFLGAGLMVVGCIGWEANPFYVGLVEGLSLPVGIGVGSMPAYSTAVLCAFYGAIVFSQVYSYMTTWNSFRDKFSFEAQMYPALFALFMLANLYVSAFAYASGAQLIKTIFADPMWDDARPVLENMAMPTLQLLSLIPLIDLFNLVVRKSVAKFGNLEKGHTQAARLLVKTPIMTHYVEQMKGEELMRALQQFTAADRQTLGIDNVQFQTDVDTLVQTNARVKVLKTPERHYGTVGTNRYGFMAARAGEGESMPLISNMAKPK